MNEEYNQAIPNARVLIYNVSVADALSYKEKMKSVDGVEEVNWLDDAENIYEPLELMDQKTVDEWYKDGDALYSLTTVSYTHLDVYKRQEYHGSEETGFCRCRR